MKQIKQIKLLVLHGPNLNLLGEREPEVYGRMTLPELNKTLHAFCRANVKLKVSLRIHQSNCEGALIDLLHKSRTWADGVVFNPGAYTHYSYALRDAVAAISIPVIEVHLSDIKRRESFRRRSVIAPVCLEQISGYGVKSYIKAIEAIIRKEANHAR